MPEVETVSPMRSDAGRTSASGSTEVLAVDTATIDELMDLEVVEGSLTDVHGDGIALSGRTRAEELGLGLGDTVTVTFAATGDVDAHRRRPSSTARSSAPATASTSSASTPSRPTSPTSSTARSS